ncbi:hypothetical protein EV2_016812 [Malus domestica]
MYLIVSWQDDAFLCYSESTTCGSNGFMAWEGTCPAGWYLWLVAAQPATLQLLLPPSYPWTCGVPLDKRFLTSKRYRSR